MLCWDFFWDLLNLMVSKKVQFSLSSTVFCHAAPQRKWKKGTCLHQVQLSKPNKPKAERLHAACWRSTRCMWKPHAPQWIATDEIYTPTILCSPRTLRASREAPHRDESCQICCGLLRLYYCATCFVTGPFAIGEGFSGTCPRTTSNLVLGLKSLARLLKAAWLLFF